MDVTFHALYINKPYYTISTFFSCSTCLGYTVHESGGVVLTCTAPRPFFPSYAHITTLCSTYSTMAPIATLSTFFPKQIWRRGKRMMLFWTYHNSYTNFDLDRSCSPNLTRLQGGYHPDDGSIFPFRNPILLNDIIMHLLHSCTHCALNHSCTILHLSRDLHLGYGGRLRHRYPSVRR